MKSDSCRMIGAKMDLCQQGAQNFMSPGPGGSNHEDNCGVDGHLEGLKDESSADALWQKIIETLYTGRKTLQGRF